MLLALPLEVLARVMAFVDPLDIINLRMSCSLLHRASIERSVWLSVYKTVLEADDLTVSAYIETTASREDLEYAALSPVLFSRRILKQPPNKMPRPARISIASPRDNFQDGVLGQPVEYIMLIPGGRYALALYEMAIEIWDFGPISPQSRAYKTIDRYTLPEPLGHWSSSMSRQRDNDFIILVMTIPVTAEAVTNVRTYTFSFDKKNPKIEESHCLRLEGAMSWDFQCPLDMDETLFVISSRERIVVWNYLEDTTGEFSPSSDAFEVFIINNRRHLVVLYEDHLCVYEMPQLKSGALMWEDLPTTAPLAVVSHPPPPHTRGSYLIAAPFYRNDRPCVGPTHIGLLFETEVEGSIIVLNYELLEPMNTSANDTQSQPSTVPRPRLVETYSQNLEADDFSIYNYELDPSTRFIFYVWTNGGLNTSLSCSVSRIGASGAREVLPSKLIYTWKRAYRLPCWSLCHKSGRLCVLTEEREVRIIDFVLPPN